MEFEAKRAEGFYAAATSNLAARDRCSMVAAEIMRAIYWRLLQDIRKDRFDVFAKRYRLSKARKLWTLLLTTLRTRWA